MEFENSQPSKVRILSVDPTNIPTSANKPAATVCNDDSESESNLSCTASVMLQFTINRLVAFKFQFGKHFTGTKQIPRGRSAFR